MSVKALVNANMIAGRRKESTTKDLKILAASRLWVILGELLLIISILTFEWAVRIPTRVRLKEFYDVFIDQSAHKAPLSYNLSNYSFLFSEYDFSRLVNILYSHFMTLSSQ